MRKLLCGLGGIILYSVVISTVVIGTFGDPAEHCQQRNESYNIADTKQCDAYHECTKGGKVLRRECSDGFVFSKEIRNCDYPHNVNCSGRELLQEPQTIGDSNCPRMNGFYAFDPEDSCQKFYHCLEGRAYEKTCPDGVIFDPSKGACIHPDLARRPDCTAKAVLNFTCPNAGKKFVRLRFGDHDRLPHSTNCRKFFICLADGKPRVGGCPLGKVFNPKLGVCDQPKRVPQCKDYYGKRDPAKLAKLAELGEEGSLSEEEIESTDDEEDDDNESEQSENSVPTNTKTTTATNNAANKGTKKHYKRDNTQFQSSSPAQQQQGQQIFTNQEPSQTSDAGKISQFETDDESDDDDSDSDD